jgi:hypothetical protein
VPEDLTSTAGIVALVAAAVAAVSLVLALTLAFKLRALRTAQRTVLGDSSSRDLVEHARQIQEGFVALRDIVESTFEDAEKRLQEHSQRIGRSISRTAVIRYDAYREMSGQQSSSMALLDEHGTGIVVSSILHREQARMYVKDVEQGRSRFELSPEERRAIDIALGPAELDVGSSERPAAGATASR